MWASGLRPGKEQSVRLSRAARSLYGGANESFPAVYDPYGLEAVVTHIRLTGPDPRTAVRPQCG
jgi:hypothetical protein